jgi:hypothetical protein
MEQRTHIVLVAVLIGMFCVVSLHRSPAENMAGSALGAATAMPGDTLSLLLMRATENVRRVRGELRVSEEATKSATRAAAATATRKCTTAAEKGREAMADTAAAIAPAAVAPVAAVDGTILGLSATLSTPSSVQTQTRLSIGGKPYDIEVCPWLKFGSNGGQPIYPRNPAKAAGNYPRINKCLAEVMAASAVASSGDVAMVLQCGSALGAYVVGGAVRGDNDLDNHIFTTKSGAELELWAKTHAPTCHGSAEINVGNNGVTRLTEGQFSEVVGTFCACPWHGGAALCQKDMILQTTNLYGPSFWVPLEGQAGKEVFTPHKKLLPRVRLPKSNGLTLAAIQKMDVDDNGRLTVTECLSFGLKSGLLNKQWVEGELVTNPCFVVNAKRHLDHLLQKLPVLVAAENAGATASANAYSSYVGAEYEGNPLTCAAEILVEKPAKELVPAITAEAVKSASGKPSYWLLDNFYFSLMYLNPNVVHREQPSGHTMLPSGKLHPTVASQPLEDLLLPHRPV